MVADREGDLFELLEEAEATRKRVGVLVRAAHNRRLQGREQKLWETLQASQNEQGKVRRACVRTFSGPRTHA
jgi:hypothetical protein